MIMRQKITVCISIGFLIFYSISIYAGRPMWTLTPQTATTLTVQSDSSATVRYTVTNQTTRTLGLAMKSIQGVTQETSNPGTCASPFSLSPYQSCTLALRLNGSALPSSINGGPVICQTNTDGTPNPSACYQPSSNNQLKITKLDIATISASVSNLALSVKCPTSSSSCIYYNAALTGRPRIITITNNSSTETALNVTYSSTQALPANTTITPSYCNILPLGNCVFTITPGQTPSATPGDINSNPITLTIAGENTNTLAVNVSILTYGSVYQAGYVFSVNDATSNTGSIAGTVAGLSDPSIPRAWQPGCSDVFTCTSTTANDYFNGANNTASIVSAFSAIPSSTYAAGICDTDTTGGYSDWYLPALCEQGYGDGSNPCGTSGSPTIQNMQSNLVDNGISDLIETYWSSTQDSFSPLNQANYNIFGIPGYQAGDYKDSFLYIRCVRSLSE